MSSGSLAIGDIAKVLVDNIKNRPIYLEIFTNWTEIVGKHIASMSIPHKVIHAGSNNVLVLKTLKGCGLEIQHESLHILIKVNNFLSKNYFSQIKVIQMDGEVT
ncbi:MAG: DUF721 domain-containing protein [Holosporaceae bacterium]|jgi:hypothetical protein|nr:DUF721 domain-containing protein [Holosporaceae bacterium]